MTKLYGIPNSRALRSIWCAEEVGLDYELVKTNFAEDSKKPEYLALNPNGRIPTLVDGDLTIFESMAINLYLAKKYGGALWPESENDQALATQWSFWGLTEVEPHLLAMLMHKVMLPESMRDPKQAKAAELGMNRPLKVLEAHLRESGGARGEETAHLLGGAFTIADLNVAAVLAMATMVRYDLSGYPGVAAWLEACTGRDSMKRAQTKGKA